MKIRGLVKFLPALMLAGMMTQSGMTAFAASETRISDGVFIEGVNVSGMTAAEAKAAVKEKVAEMGESTLTVIMGDNPVTVTMNSLGLKWNNPEILDEVMQLGTTGNIVQRYKDQKDLQNQNKDYDLKFSTDGERVRELVENCQVYNSEPVNGEIYVQDDGMPGVEGGTDGLTLRVDESMGLVNDALKNWNGDSMEVELAVDRVSPDISKESLSMITDVLGRATTDYGNSDYGRAVNVENGCSKVSGTLLMPGESFSVTDVVVPFTPENGYELAASFEENKVVDSYGGGICQVSTTLYNAVLKAELEILARSNHTMIVGYVDPSKDAAIAEGIMDLAFRNDTDYPIYIDGYAYGGELTFAIYGHETRPDNRYIEFVSEVTSVTEPTGSVMVANPAQPVGYVNQTTSPHTGYTAELWKYVYVDGELVDTIQVNSSTYQAVGVAYEVGVASEYPALTQAMYAAIATNDLTQVQAVMSGSAAYLNPQAQTQPVLDPNTGLYVDPMTGLPVDPNAGYIQTW